MTGTELPETFEELRDKRRFWPAPAGSHEEGLGMLRILTPDVVANAARSEIRNGERVCLNWNIEQLDPPGTYGSLFLQESMGQNKKMVLSE